MYYNMIIHLHGFLKIHSAHVFHSVYKMLMCMLCPPRPQCLLEKIFASNKENPH